MRWGSMRTIAGLCQVTVCVCGGGGGRGGRGELRALRALGVACPA